MSSPERDSQWRITALREFSYATGRGKRRTKWYATYEGVDTGTLIEECELWSDQYGIILQAGYTNPIQATLDGDHIYVKLNERNRIEAAWHHEGGILDTATARRKAKEALYGVKFD